MSFVRPTLSVFLFALASALHGQGVQLDQTFAPTVSDGRAAGRFMALQPDGKILADNLRVRYNADGTIDSTYKLGPTLGVVTAPVRVASDGKIVVQSRTDRDDVLNELNSDGSLSRVLLTAVPSSATFAALQPDGKILLTGPFAMTFNGVTRNSVARLNRDGSLDTTFNPGLGAQNSGGGLSLAVQSDGKILVGGIFTGFDGVARRHLVRLNANGLVDPTFNYPTTAPVESVGPIVALPGGKILAIDITPPTSRLIRLNADGTIDLVIAADQSANDLFVQPDGRVLIAGGFTRFNGAPLRNLARLNSDGALDATFNANAAMLFDLDTAGGDQPVLRVALQADGKIFFAEGNTLNNVTDRLLRLNPDGAVDATFQPGQPRAPVVLTAARQADGHIVIAGGFTFVNGVTRPGLARLNADGTLDPTFAPAVAPSDVIIGLGSLADGRIVVASGFCGIGDPPRASLTCYLANGALDPAFSVTLNSGAAINALLVLPDGHVVIAGDFSTVNGTARGNLAGLQADGSLEPAFANVTVNGPVHLLALRPNGGVFAAGTFSTVAGQRRNNLAALTAGGSLDTSFIPSSLTTSDVISVLAAAPDGGAIIGGPPPAGSLRSALRRLTSNGDIDPAFTFGLAVNADFSALAIDAQGRAVAAYTGIETRDSFSDTSHRYLQRFTPTGAVDPLFNVGAGPSAPVTSIVVAPDGTLLVGGAFRSFDDLPIGPLVQLPPGIVPPPNLLFNISTRSETSPGATILTAGFVIGGSVPKTVLLRATGPGLAAFGLADTLPDPVLTLRSVDGSIIASNDNWSDLNLLLPRPTDAGFNITQTAARVGAFPWQSPLEAALVATLPPGNYTAQVSAAGGTQAKTTGTTLIEVYDANVFPGDRRLLNISTRGTAGSAERTLIAGFVITGSASKTVLIRAAGPGLAPFNVSGTIADPILTVVNNAGATVATNDDWSTSANKADIAAAAINAGAFPLTEPSKDSALLLTLPPGNYTALVNGANGGTGVALVEVYEVP
jgi:uncharacterized delta-60 repeat protein